ncbi:hypothetical protein [Skermania sp. ID1734]|nr:hypothetical protein [Skermania sp. ID1734]
MTENLSRKRLFGFGDLLVAAARRARRTIGAVLVVDDRVGDTAFLFSAG